MPPGRKNDFLFSEKLQQIWPARGPAPPPGSPPWSPPWSSAPGRPTVLHLFFSTLNENCNSYPRKSTKNADSLKKTFPQPQNCIMPKNNFPIYLRFSCLKINMRVIDANNMSK